MGDILDGLPILVANGGGAMRVGEGSALDVDNGHDLVTGTFSAPSSTDSIAFAMWTPAPGTEGEDACADIVARAAKDLGRDVDFLVYQARRYDGLEYLCLDPCFHGTDAVKLSLRRLSRLSLDPPVVTVTCSDNLYRLSELQTAGKLQHLGVADFDLPHLQLLDASGYTVTSNHVSVSVLDRRADKRGMLGWCAAHNVGILAYGTLLGGFVSEAWLAKPEPKPHQLEDSLALAKYKRFIDAAGGWHVFQEVLLALDRVAKKHNVTIPAIAMRHVLDLPGVTSLIAVSDDETEAAFGVSLDETDRATIVAAQGGLTDIAADCGDEYRYPPFLTPSGDGSRPTKEEAKMLSEVERVINAGGRVERSSGSAWEPIAGYCRAVRVGNVFEVAGTTTRTHPSGHGIMGGTSAEHQATYVFDIVSGAIRSIGGSMADVTRTRGFLTQVDNWVGVTKVQGREMARYGVRPVCTMVGGSTFVMDGQLLELEVQGIIGAAQGPLLRLE